MKQRKTPSASMKLRRWATAGIAAAIAIAWTITSLIAPSLAQNTVDIPLQNANSAVSDSTVGSGSTFDLQWKLGDKVNESFAQIYYHHSDGSRATGSNPGTYTATDLVSNENIRVICIDPEHSFDSRARATNTYQASTYGALTYYRNHGNKQLVVQRKAMYLTEELGKYYAADDYRGFFTQMGLPWPSAKDPNSREGKTYWETYYAPHYYDRDYRFRSLPISLSAPSDDINRLVAMAVMQGAFWSVNADYDLRNIQFSNSFWGRNEATLLAYVAGSIVQKKIEWAGLHYVFKQKIGAAGTSTGATSVDQSYFDQNGNFVVDYTFGNDNFAGTTGTVTVTGMPSGGKLINTADGSLVVTGTKVKMPAKLTLVLPDRTNFSKVKIHIKVNGQNVVDGYYQVPIDITGAYGTKGILSIQNLPNGAIVTDMNGNTLTRQTINGLPSFNVDAPSRIFVRVPVGQWNGPIVGKFSPSSNSAPVNRAAVSVMEQSRTVDADGNTIIKVGVAGVSDDSTAKIRIGNLPAGATVVTQDGETLGGGEQIAIPNTLTVTIPAGVPTGSFTISAETTSDDGVPAGTIVRPTSYGNGQWMIVIDGPSAQPASAVAGIKINWNTINQRPSISTTATSNWSDKKILRSDQEGATITDTVSYTNVKPGTSYKLYGQLKAFDANGNEINIDKIEKTTDQYADAATGKWVMTFENIKRSTIEKVAEAGGHFVVFETLFDYSGQNVLAEHADKNDQNQTIGVTEVPKPKLSTVAYAKVNGENVKKLPFNGIAKDPETLNTPLVDTVTLNNLVDGKTYTVKGYFVDENGTPVTDTVYKSFRASGQPNEEVTVEFEGLKGNVNLTEDSKFTAFEYLYEGVVNAGNVDRSEVVASHEDPKDVEQTVTVDKPKPTKVKVVKVVDDQSAGTKTIPREFLISAAYITDRDQMHALANPNRTDGLWPVTADGSVEIGPIPVGADLQLTEQTMGADLVTWTSTKNVDMKSFNVKGSPSSVKIYNVRPDADGYAAVVTLTNTYTPTNTSFVLRKQVNKDDSTDGKIFKDHTFTFHYVCTAPDGQTKKEGDLSLKVDKSDQNNWLVGTVTVQDIPKGASCEVSETGADVKGVTLVKSQSFLTNNAYGITPGQTVKFTLPDYEDPCLEVVFNNYYETPKGSFTVNKTISGDANNFDFSAVAFNVSYTCTLDGKENAKGTLSVYPGGSNRVSNVPLGSECKVNEVEPIGKAGFVGPTVTYKVDGKPTDTDSASFKIESKEKTVQVSVDNAYKVEKGTFSFQKKVEGKTDLKKFAFRVQCSDGTESTVTLTPDQVWKSPELKLGTVCTVQETTDLNGLYSKGEITWDKNTNTDPKVLKVTISKAGENGQYVATNHFEERQGGFEMVKTVNSVDGLDIPRDFDFEYSCVERNGNPVDGKSGKFNLTADGKTKFGVSGIPVGSTCTITETPKSVANANPADGTVSWTVNGTNAGNIRTVTLKIDYENQVVKVAANNVYTPENGGFTVHKVVDDNKVKNVLQKKFRFTYTCTDGSNGSFDLGNGDSKTVTGVAANATCKLWENLNTAKVNNSDHSLSWNVNQGKATVGDDQVVNFKVIPNAAFDFTAVNIYRQHFGKVAFKKVVTGDLKDGNSKKFKFDYNCTDGTTGSVELTNGQTHVIDELPIPTSCNITEDNANVAGYKHTLSWNGGVVKDSTVTVVASKKGETVTATATNNYEQKKTSLKLVKKLDIPQEYLDQAQSISYEFNYSCSFDNAVVKSGKLELAAVNKDGISIDDIPVNATCTITETPKNITNLNNTGVTFKVDGKVSGDGDSVIIPMTENSQKVISVEATNHYTQGVGEFSIAKKTSGTGAHADSYTFNYTCYADASRKVERNHGELTVKVGDKAAVVKDIPLGSVCDITEKDPNVFGSTATVNWDGATALGTNGATFAVTETNPSPEIIATNDSVLKNGTFMVKKVVSGDTDNLDPNKEFTFKYECNVGEPGEIKVKAGETKTSPEFPHGTTCKVWEDEASAQVDGKTLTVSMVGGIKDTDGKVSVTINGEDSAKVIVTADNNYTDIPKIGTKLATVDGQSGSITLSHDRNDDVTLVDTITYENLRPEHTYVFEGKLLADGDPNRVIAKGFTRVTVAQRNGSVDVKFVVPAEVLRGVTKVVAFEKAWLSDQVTVSSDNSVIAKKNDDQPAGGKHEDPNDANQTLTVDNLPAISTTAKGAGDTKLIDAKADSKLVDTVSYYNLPSGKYVLAGVLVDKESGKVVSGVAPVVTDAFEAAGNGTKDVTFTIPAGTVSENANYVVYEWLYKADNVTFDGDNGTEQAEDGVIAAHADIDSVSQTVTTPGVKTNAKDGLDNDKYLTPKDGVVKVVDVVSYTNLTVGKVYTVDGTLMNKKTNKPLQVNGAEVKASTTFQASAPNGTVQLTFTVPAAALVEGPFVAFEKLSYNGIPVGAHEDINDKDQTVYSPKLKTTATVKVNGAADEKMMLAGESATIKDVVNYEGLKANTKYRLEGTLMDKITGSAVSGASAKPVEFTTDASGNGSVEMTFEVAASAVKEGSVFVAFEAVYEAGSNIKIASHENIADVDQTVYVPKARTKASSNLGKDNAPATGTVKVTDVVTYTNLVVGKEYTVDGELMYKDGSGSTGVKASKTFTADRANGFVTLEFEVPAEKLQGKTVVAFESVKHEGREVAVHKDLNDEEQSVYSPNIRTSAKNKANNSQFVKAGEDATVVDTVSYEGLAVSKVMVDGDGNTKFDGNGKAMTEDAYYTVVGELMKVTADGVESTGITASKTFHPTTAAGTVNVEFTVPGKQIEEGTTFVVYEKLYEGKDANGKFVASHEDPKDAGQTVTAPKVTTNAADNTDGDKYLTPDAKGTVQVKDVVTYTNLIPGKEYTISGKLHYKSGDKKGQEVPGVSASKKFTPTADNAAKGTVELVFEVPASLLRGETVVAFEKVSHQNLVVGAHEDINDEAQTVYSPDVTTKAVAKGTDKQVVPVGTDAVIQDTVSYRSLKPGTEYTLVGTLMDKNTGKAVEGVEKVTKTFTPTEMDGQEVVEFKVPASKISAGSAFVVFQEIREGDKVVATHNDLGAQTQTVVSEGTPAIGTSVRNAASDEADMRVVPAGKDATLVDTVSYQNLTPGTEYTVSGVLMKKVGGKVTATEVTASADFTPAAASGTVDVTFTVPADVLEANTSFVVFEKVTKKGSTTVIASHEDPNDPAQTVTVPEIRTHATGDNGKYINPNGTRKVVDRVTYTNLQVGKEYTFNGELMYQSGPKAGQGTGVKSSAKFTPANAAEAKAGYVEITFEVPADLLVEGPFVAFEDVYYKNVEVGFHKDITDKEQTTYTPSIGTKAVNESDSSKFLTPGEGARIVDTVTYKQLVPGKTYVLSGKLIDKSTCKGDDASTCQVVPGSYVVKSEPFTASDSGEGSVEVVFYIPGASVKENQQYVVFEYLYDGTEPSGKPVTKHENPKDENQTVTGKGNPRLATNAVSAGDSKNVVANTATTIVDTVSYYNLKPETTYTVSGSLVEKSSGSVIDGVSGSTTFTTPAAKDGLTVVNGTVDVTLNVPANTLIENFSYVVFEKIYEGSTASGDVVASHEDPNDEAQTVTTPQIKTSASDENGNKVLSKPADPNATVKVIDRVSYTNLKVGKKYSIDGELMYKSGPNAGKGTGITSFTEFKAESSSGSVELTFEVPAHMLQSGPFVAFEKVYYGGYLVGSHQDLTDKDQTVYTPEIGTTAFDAADSDKTLEPNTDANLTDVVAYKQLIPGETYRLEGTLMDKNTGNPVMSAHAEPVIFKADASGNGSVEVNFWIPGSAVNYDAQFVVFENLYLESTSELVATHSDINDSGQTVVVPPAPIPGKITLTKKLAGAYDVVADREFQFSYTCSLKGTEIAKGDLTLVKDQTETIGTYPIGTVCNITENLDSAAKDVDRKHQIAWTVDGQKSFVNAADPATITATISTEGQTVDVIATNTYEENPAITTLATAANSEDVIKYADANYLWGKMINDANVYVKAGSDITDTVSWSNLPAGEYLLYGTLQEWGDTKVIGSESKKVSVNSGDKEGKFELTFVAPKRKDATAYTVYESVYRIEDIQDNGDGTYEIPLDAKPIAEHKIMSSKAQTFGVPVDAPPPYSPPDGKLILKKEVAGDAAGIANGKSFKFDIHCGGVKQGAPSLTNGGSWTSGELKANTNCDIVEDKDSAESFKGDNTWTLSWSGDGITVDPTNNKVTVRIPEVKEGGEPPTVVVTAKNVYTSPSEPVVSTYASSTDGSQLLTPGMDATITDRVTYVNLKKGEEYTVVGTLMDKATGEPVEGLDQQKVTFPSQGTGNVSVTFTIPADKVKENSHFVVFEKVYKGTDTSVKPVASHEDFNDAGQTVDVPTTPPPPDIPEKPWKPRLAQTGADALVIGFGSLILLGVGAAIIMVTRRRKED